MKKILNPLVVLVILVMLALLVPDTLLVPGHRGKAYKKLRALIGQTYQIGDDLIRQTNSSLLSISPGLRNQLTNFLASPANVERALFGDYATQNSKADSRLRLTNGSGSRIELRLKRLDPDKFHVLSFSTNSLATHY